jgi:hypothetical protein
MYEVVSEIREIIEKACGANFNRYVVGKIDYPKVKDLPLFCVYGTTTTLSPTGELTTCKDKYRYSITVDIFAGFMEKTSSVGNNVDDEVKTQKYIYELMEKRTDNIPNADTVLGALRRLALLRGKTFLFTGDITIDYTTEIVNGSRYYKGTMILEAVSNYNPRVPTTP